MGAYPTLVANSELLEDIKERARLQVRLLIDCR
jgi:hypothetical protein